MVGNNFHDEAHQPYPKTNDICPSNWLSCCFRGAGVQCPQTHPLKPDPCALADPTKKIVAPLGNELIEAPIASAYQNAMEEEPAKTHTPDVERDGTKLVSQT